jgi:hypothetical protein
VPAALVAPWLARLTQRQQSSFFLALLPTAPTFSINNTLFRQRRRRDEHPRTYLVSLSLDRHTLFFDCALDPAWLHGDRGMHGFQHATISTS